MAASNEPVGPFMPPTRVQVPFSMLREHFPGEPALLGALVRLQAELDPAARVVPELTPTERSALLALKRSKVPLPTRTLCTSRASPTGSGPPRRGR